MKARIALKQLSENGQLTSFFRDLIYSAVKEKLGREEASQAAARLAPIYTALVEQFMVTYQDVSGGYADDTSFSISLADGREIVGNYDQARIV
jgi:hypothetical protein